ncbi:MAG TPA: PQQ-binding-like beta-propeller repeat protein [Gemmatimonadaceae bacterium]|nr:PQQ-binding-like beta-propeller repeat protein [Gemmatimonadaceae bacterium]
MSPLVRLCAFALLASCGASTASRGSDTSSHQPNPTVSGHDWTQFDVDEARSGVFDSATGISAAALPALRLQRVQIDGTVDASAIYLHDVEVGGAAHDVFFVTTTYGKTLAIDAGDGTVLWRFTPATYGQMVGTPRITNATPVADPDRTAIYAASPDGNVQKLAVADGHVVWSTAVTQLPQREKLASPLNFSRGHVIIATGGYVGDAPAYQGHVAVLDAATGKLTSAWNSLCSDRAGLLDPTSCAQSGSAIWGRAGAVVDPATGNIFVATGNGHWDGGANWGDAIIELDPGASRILANYTPQNTDVLDASDADLGSTSPVLLDATHVAQGGKDGHIRVVDLQAASGAAPHRGGEAQSVSTPSGGDLFTAPVVLHRADGVWLIAADGGGTAAWTYSGGRLAPAWSNGNAGTSPVVAGGLLYVYDPGGVLRVYDPTSGRQVGSLQSGSGHWNSPIVADGRIALPEGSANSRSTSGVLNIWRLP